MNFARINSSMLHTKSFTQERIEEMLGLVITDPGDTAYVVEQITGQGPKHKQELSGLLISRILELVRITEAKSGKEFSPQDGFEFTTGKDETPVLPLLMPIVATEGIEVGVLADHIAQAPEHELLAFSLSLQGIEWVISQTSTHS